METGASPKLCFTQAKLEKMMLDLNKILTSAVEDLKRQLRPPSGMPVRRGVFDTLKNWWGNLRHGFQSPNNPYYHQNVMGHLGKPVAEMSLSEYKYFFEKAKILEENVLLIERKLQLDVELDRWLADLKGDLSNYFGAKLSQLAMQTQKKTEKEAAKKLEKELKQKIPLAAGDFEKSFFDKYRLPKKDDELLGLPPETNKTVTAAPTELAPDAKQSATDVARTPLDPEAAEKLQRKIMPPFKGGDAGTQKQSGSKQIRASRSKRTDDPKTIVNPAEVQPQPEKTKEQDKIVLASLPSAPPKRGQSANKSKEPLSDLLQQSSVATQAQSSPLVTQAMVEPKVGKGKGKRNGNSNQPVSKLGKKDRPSAGGDFFDVTESHANLKLNGLTLYEKTLVCLEKLRS